MVLGKIFKCSKLHCYAHFNVCACTLVHSKCVIWVCSSKVEAVWLAASVSFLSPAMYKSSDRNKTSTRYKAIIQFWKLSVVNPASR